SKVIIYLKSDAMIPGDMMGGEVRILGSVTNAKIDLNEGTVIAEGETGEVVAADEVMQKDGFEIAVKAIIVPQTLKKGVKWLDIKTLGGYSYFSELPEDLIFQPGKQMTLSVSIESGECHVTVEEIEDWIETETPIVGEVVEDLPTFKLYDFYNLNGVQGLVIAVDETGKHGVLISLDEERTQWCTEPSLMAQAYSAGDAQENLNEVLNVDPTLEKFPAMKWCMDKNKDGISGWYMPALNELRDFWNILYTNTDLINDKIVATGVTGATEIKTNWWDTDGYFSSSLSLSDKVRSISFSMFGDGISVALLSQDASSHVRAFYKF
ncbi:MAG: fimbrillin family protein, partial [Butyricimonas faecihominis]